MFKLIAVTLLLILTGCAGSDKQTYAPVTDINRAPAKYTGNHIVEQGETLYSIAWRYNRDFVELARINGIRSPYRIKEGQVLELAAQRSRAVVVNSKLKPNTSPQSADRRVEKAMPSQTIVASGEKPRWQWPTAGKIIQYFSSQNEQKGIDLAGKKGQPILAAAHGEVVYSGDGLRGYGKLIIIKHNDEFLSAYAHNSKLLVSEGTVVNASQKIAEMGQSDAAKPILHFEIRRHGNPVDPLQFLPRQG